jgi:hypothetical protein
VVQILLLSLLGTKQTTMDYLKSLVNLFSRKSVAVIEEVPTLFTISKFDAFTCIGYIGRVMVDGKALEFYSDNLENETLADFKGRLTKMCAKVEFIEDF